MPTTTELYPRDLVMIFGGFMVERERANAMQAQVHAAMETLPPDAFRAGTRYSFHEKAWVMGAGPRGEERPLKQAVTFRLSEPEPPERFPTITLLEMVFRVSSPG